MSAWCRLDQERSYCLYQRHNETEEAELANAEVDFHSGEYPEMEEPDPARAMYYVMEDDSVISRLTEKENNAEIPLFP